MKARNKRKNLQARIEAWDLLKPDDTRKGGKVKIIQGAGFTKPGSIKK